MEYFISDQLSTPVSEDDHIYGSSDASVTIVEFGDYQCSHCLLASSVIEDVLEKLEGEIRFVFRHFPLKKIHTQSQLAAEAAEAAGAQNKYWEMHKKLYLNQNNITNEKLMELAKELELDTEKFQQDLNSHVHLKKIDNHFIDGVKSGVSGTPTFFINNKKYTGAFDVESILDQIQKPLGVRIRLLTQEFARLEYAGGLLLFLFAMIALLVANIPFLSKSYFSFWQTLFNVSLGSNEIHQTLFNWINDGLMTISFFVIGLEIKREVTVGELASFRKVILPITGAIGGMIFPALIFIFFNLYHSENLSGWGIPIATDIAFSIVLLRLLGKKVPLSLKDFFTTLAKADDLGDIVIISIFYSHKINYQTLILSIILCIGLLILNKAKIFWILPYSIIGIILWLSLYSAGLDPTIAGILLATAIPTRSSSNTPALLSQCNLLLEEFQVSPHQAEERRQAMARTLEQISERMLTPAQRLERDLHPWTTFLILPIFAFANAGVLLNLKSINILLDPINLGIIFGLVLGKPLGISLFVFIATKLKIAELPVGITWSQFIKSSFITGIGFTMSIFITNEAFGTNYIFIENAKIGILLASLLASCISLLLLYKFESNYEKQTNIELPVVTM